MTTPIEQMKANSRPRANAKGEGCSAARIIAAIPAKNRKAIEAAMFDPEHQDITIRAIVDWMVEAGYPIPESTLRLHRRRKCPCVNR